MNSKIKNFIRYLLWLVGLRKLLPKFVIDNIKIIENNEPLVEISQCDKLIFYQKNNLIPYLRKSVVQKLYKVVNLLPEGYRLVLIEAYRSRENQEKKWIDMISSIKRDNPELSEDEIKRRTRVFVAEPTGNGPHQTGGAVDVTITFQNNEVDMGTKWCEFNKKTETFSREITKDQRKNRKILLKIMQDVGFKNYPGEWWHYSYGDRMWGAYNRLKTCFYGSIDINNTR